MWGGRGSGRPRPALLGRGAGCPSAYFYGGPFYQESGAVGGVVRVGLLPPSPRACRAPRLCPGSPSPNQSVPGDGPFHSNHAANVALKQFYPTFQRHMTSGRPRTAGSLSKTEGSFFTAPSARPGVPPFGEHEIFLISSWVIFVPPDALNTA